MSHLISRKEKEYLVQHALNYDLTCIFGPTACGKSALALTFAKILEDKEKKAAIINADSMQIYKDLHCLSARPSREEEAEVQHYLYGFLSGNQIFNAARWNDAAMEAVELCQQDNKYPILVGGTGFYLKTFLEGLSPVPRVNSDIEKTVRNMDNRDLESILQKTDELHLKDQQRRKRAVSVYLSTGKSLSHWHKITPTPTRYRYQFIILWPEREWLYQRINQRVKHMMGTGYGGNKSQEGPAIVEVENLMKQSYPHDAPVMHAIGVPEIMSCIKGEITHAQALEATQQATRRYAKRQFTWMRKEQSRRCQDENFLRINTPERL